MIPQKAVATLKDIARQTGYSVNTVSRALRDKEDVAHKTRERIRRVAAEMGYISNKPAASLRLGYTKTIAVILGDISNPHFAVMMKEIEARAREYGYISVLLNTNEETARETDAIRAALNQNVDGIILCPARQDIQNLQFLKRLGIPFVLIGRRQEGYRRAYSQAALIPDERLIREIPVTSSGYEEVFAQLEREKVHYTGVFAFSDMLAWEAWDCLRRRGVSVPQDCSLVGFDHIQSRLTLPFALTSVSSSNCTACGACVRVCPVHIRRIAGVRMTSRELAELHRALETCGYCSRELFKRALEHLEYVMMDIKLCNPEKHIRYTGVDNKVILQNARALCQGETPFVIRIPVIPGVNDNEENYRATAELLKGARALLRVEFLPYSGTDSQKGGAGKNPGRIRKGRPAGEGPLCTASDRYSGRCAGSGRALPGAGV